MKIIFYNIAYGSGVNGSKKSYLKKSWGIFRSRKKVIKKMAEFLKEQIPHVVALTEVDEGSFRNRFNKQSVQLNQYLKFKNRYSSFKYGKKSFMQYLPGVKKNHGVILSDQGSLKTHYLESGVKKLVQELCLPQFNVLTLHLSVVSKRTRKKQLNEIAQILKKKQKPYVIGGDFNCLKGLNELSEFVEELNLNWIQFKNTFPSIKPKKPLDLILASPSIKVRSSGVYLVDYSDHLPVWIEIDL